MKYLLVIALFLVNALAHGVQDNWLPLKGKLKVASEPLSDPAPHGDPVAYISVDGAGAKAIYEGMKGFKTITNACGEPGLVSRTVGDVVCYRNKSSYSCEFGIRLSDGVIRTGRAC